MAILKSTVVNGDLTVTGSLNVQGDLTYVGVKNLRVKDHQIELNANDEGSASLAGANEAGIVIRGAQNTQKNPNSKEASILYNHTNDSLVINKTIEGTVSNATTAASANKVAQKLTVNVTDKTGTVETVFDGSEAKTVDVNLKELQDQIDSLTGEGAGSVATQINNAINDLNSTVTAKATGTAAKDGVFVLQEVKIDEGAGKLTSATPKAVEVEKAGAAAAAKTDLIGTDDDTANSATIKGAKKYADSLAGNYAKASHKHEIGDVNGLQGALDGKAAKLHTHATSEITGLDTALAGKQDNLSEAQLKAVDSGVTAAKVTGYDKHVADKNIHVTTADKDKWNAAEDNAKAYADGLASNYDAAGAAATAETNAKKYTDDEIKKLGSAAKKNVLEGAIADSTSEDLVTAAQVKAYAAGVVGAMHFRGAVGSTDEIKNPASGDICLVGTKEYVYNGTEWVLFGDESAYDTKGTAAQALKDAKTYADGLNTAMDGRVGALEAIDHNAYVAADATTLESAKTYADELAAGKADTSHKHAITDVTGLQDALAGKAAVDHNHDDVYSKLGHTHAIANVTGLQDALDAKQDDLSADQLNAVNSGITSAKVSDYDAHVADTTIHVTTADKTKWNAAEANAKKHADEKVAELKNTVDSLSADVLKGVAAGKYVSVSAKSDNSQTISVTTKDVASASDTANGLALAADVKKYVDDKNALQDAEINKIKDGTTLDDRYVNADGDTMTGKLTMNAADIEMSNNGTNGIVFGNMKIVWNSTDSAIEFVAK